jgi:hypothetical protein
MNRLVLALTFAQAVTLCTVKVHQEMPGAYFDAFASDIEGQVHFIGYPPAAEFIFEKCMHDHGHELSNISTTP